MTRSRFKGMTVYTKDDFARIGEAIGKSGNKVEAYRSKFEAAAMWFRSASRTPERLAPSKEKRKLRQISKSAHRLLANLGIEDPQEAPAGKARKTNPPKAKPRRVKSRWLRGRATSVVCTSTTLPSVDAQ